METSSFDAPNKHSGKRNRGYFLGLLLGIGLFTAAVLVIRHTFRDYSLAAVIDTIRLVSARQVFLAGLLTVCYYCILTLYDYAALKYIRHPVGYPRAALVSFIAYALSNNLGATLFTGATIRCRFYLPWGISLLDISRAVAFNFLSFIGGTLVMSSVFLLFLPMSLFPRNTLPPIALRGLGIVFIAVLIASIVAARVFHRPIKISGRAIELPQWWVIILMLCVSTLDWIVSASVLYVLMQHTGNISFAMIAGSYVFGQLLGALSNVPGGLGVFESAFLLFQPFRSGALPAVGGVLIVYRIIYYLIPLVLGTAALLIHEIVTHGKLVHRVAQKLFCAKGKAKASRNSPC